jgi:hypothetical protein
MYSYNIGNSLIETVNELGSIFYGPILGVFLVAFFFKKIRSGDAVFYATLVTQVLIFSIYIPAKLKLIGLGFSLAESDRCFWGDILSAWSSIQFSEINFLQSRKAKTQKALSFAS